MCDFDVEGPEWCERTTPIARKPHRCVECRLPILPGVRYERLVGVWDHEFQTFRSHVDCAEVHRRLGTALCGSDGWALGDLRGFLREHLHEYGDDPSLRREFVEAWRVILRARRAEGAWPAPRAAA